MNIYHCCCLDEDLKLPDFKITRTETLINVFIKCNPSHLNHPLLGLLSVMYYKVSTFCSLCQIIRLDYTKK